MRRTGSFLLALLLTILLTPLAARAGYVDEKKEKPRPRKVLVRTQDRSAASPGQNRKERSVNSLDFDPQSAPGDEDKEKTRLRLGITREQQAQIEALYTESEQHRRDINARMLDIYQQINVLYASFDYDRAQARSLRAEILALHRRRLTLFAENEEKLRRILNREQFERLRALMREQRARETRDRTRKENEREAENRR